MHDGDDVNGDHRSVRALRDQPVFVRWALAEAVTMTGTAMSFVVLPVLIFDLTGSAGWTGLVFATRLVPYLLFGLVAGPVADRWNRRRLIIGGNLIEGTLVATVPLAAAFDVLTIAHVFGVAFLSATAYVFSDAAVFGAVPALVPRERLAAANGLLSTLAAAADIVGPILAGVLVATIGAANALSLDAASFIAAAAVQSTIRSNFRRNLAPHQRSLRTQLSTAFGFIRRQRTVLVLTAVGFGNSIGIGIVLGLLVPWSVEIQGYEPDDPRLGIIYASIGVGSLIAGLVFARLFTPARVRLLTPATVALSAASTSVMLVSIPTFAAAPVGVFAIGIMLTITTGITYRQLATPDQLTSTVNTIGRMIAAGGQPFGAAIGAAVATITSVNGAYRAATAALTVTALSAHMALNRHDTALAD
ncbi:MAG: MFS transporter [Actinomycetota bacterium]